MIKDEIKLTEDRQTNGNSYYLTNFCLENEDGILES